MSPESFRNPDAKAAWRRDFDRLLTRGATPIDAQALHALLDAAPTHWPALPDTQRAPALPAWTAVMANPHGDWACKALREIESRLPGPADPGRPEPLFLALLDDLGQLNPTTYLDFLSRRPQLAAHRPERLEWGLRWFSRLFAAEPPNATVEYSRIQAALVEGMFRHVPQLCSGPPAQRLWVMGLGLAGSPGGLGALRAAAMRGLDGAIELPRDRVPPIAQQAWDELAGGRWQLAPAWAWAAALGVFLGSRMLLREAVASQTQPWDPNAPLPDTDLSVGRWLLDLALAPRPSDALVDHRVHELEELGFDWLAGEPGNRAFDALAHKDVGPKAWGAAAWETLSTRAAARQLGRVLPPSLPPPGPRSRL